MQSLIGIIDVWGGRTNHIGFFSGESLSDDEWREITLADPDCIMAFAQLPEELHHQLSERIAPWSVDGKAESGKIDMPIDGIGVLPTFENLRRLGARTALN